MLKNLAENRLFPFLVVAVCFLIPGALFYSFSGLKAFDSYYFYNYVCNPATPHFYKPQIDTFASKMVLDFLPCNEFVLKTIILALFGASLLAFYLIGEFHRKGSGFLMVLFACMGVPAFTRFLKLENDVFGFPFLFFGLYFFLKHLKAENDFKNLFLSLNWFVVGLFFWGGGIYLLLALILVQPWLGLISLPISWLNADRVIGNMVPNLFVYENNPMVGLIFSLFFLSPLILLPSHKKILTLFRFPAAKSLILIGIFAMFNPKFYILALPGFGMLLINLFHELEDKYQAVLIALSLAFVCIGLFAFYWYPPTPTEIQAVQEFVQTGKDLNLPLSNDFAYGHMIWFYGGHTPIWGGLGMGDVKDANNSLVLSRENLDCKLLKTYDWSFLGEHLRMWKC